MKTTFTGYWMFFCNPKRWEIDKYFESNTLIDTFSITDWQKEWFSPGQLGIIRVGVDKRSKKQLNGRKKLESGIYGIVEVISHATLQREINNSFWAEEKDKDSIRYRVNIRYLTILNKNPIKLSELLENEIVSKNIYVTNGFQGSSIPIDEKCFNEIINTHNIERMILEEFWKEEEDINEIELKYANASAVVKYVLSKRIERGPLSKTIKEKYGFKCLLCHAKKQNAIGFISRNGFPYIEAHHIDFVSKLNEGCLGLANMITVCPNHHRQIHFGNIELIKNNKTNVVYRIDGEEITIEK